MSNANMINVTIDDKKLQVEQGTTVLAAARANGIEIPTLCYLAGVNEIGSCRVCVVEVEGWDNLPASCNTPCQEGMVVRTNTPRVIEARRMALALLLDKHGLDTTNYCFSCHKNGACELQTLCFDYNVHEPLLPTHLPHKPVMDSNPFLRFDPNLCIGCQRCVSTCNRQARNHVLRTGKRGVRTAIMAPFGEGWKATECESCGNCAAACPTGALVEKRRATYREWEVEKVLTTCPHCATGCQMYLVVKDGHIVDVEPADGPTNKGLLCVKGRSASFDFVDSPERLRTPLVKNPQTGEFEATTWDEALDLVAKRMSEIRDRDGGDALAAFACSRSTNEDIYLLQKMGRTAFKTNNIDNCARV